MNTSISTFVAPARSVYWDLFSRLFLGSSRYSAGEFLVDGEWWFSFVVPDALLFWLVVFVDWWATKLAIFFWSWACIVGVYVALCAFLTLWVALDFLLFGLLWSVPVLAAFSRRVFRLVSWAGWVVYYSFPPVAVWTCLTKVWQLGLVLLAVPESLSFGLTPGQDLGNSLVYVSGGWCRVSELGSWSPSLWPWAVSGALCLCFSSGTPGFVWMAPSLPAVLLFADSFLLLWRVAGWAAPLGRAPLAFAELGLAVVWPRSAIWLPGVPGWVFVCAACIFPWFVFHQRFGTATADYLVWEWAVNGHDGWSTTTVENVRAFVLGKALQSSEGMAAFSACGVTGVSPRLRRRGKLACRLQRLFGLKDPRVSSLFRGRWMPDLPAVERGPVVNAALSVLPSETKAIGVGALPAKDQRDGVFVALERPDGSRAMFLPSLHARLFRYAYLRPRDQRLFVSLRSRAADWARNSGLAPEYVPFVLSSAVELAMAVSPAERACAGSLGLVDGTDASLFDESL